ncbi:putative nucleic acid-binding protein [Spinactinospora alkalitolerans]|uniref:Ribonuclease VapC n=1 Tax=Spinactinospora alkalitolerans TaxID=687207 RepID=A0A852TZE3_9ACTN|nr:type II toxin-antitoxin system VapC family toxin [Spinactinospora alkalitolerans]NYE48677.1 putative nucleic acid-binding protein [Spinactinospora alkalitolerans]
MIVVDTSAIIALTIHEPRGMAVEARLRGRRMYAPHFVDLEVANVLRGLLMGGKLTLPPAEQALHDFLAMPVERRDLGPLISRVWELRHNYSAYDAAYVALAENLGATLLTTDAKLARGTGARCPIELVS